MDGVTSFQSNPNYYGDKSLNKELNQQLQNFSNDNHSTESSTTNMPIISSNIQPKQATTVQSNIFDEWKLDSSRIAVRVCAVLCILFAIFIMSFKSYWTNFNMELMIISLKTESILKCLWFLEFFTVFLCLLIVYGRSRYIASSVNYRSFAVLTLIGWVFSLISIGCLWMFNKVTFDTKEHPKYIDWWTLVIFLSSLWISCFLPAFQHIVIFILYKILIFHSQKVGDSDSNLTFDFLTTIAGIIIVQVLSSFNCDKKMHKYKECNFCCKSSKKYEPLPTMLNDEYQPTHIDLNNNYKTANIEPSLQQLENQIMGKYTTKSPISEIHLYSQ